MTREILFDSRWSGPHGIGRFSAELRLRMPPGVIDLHGAHPVSPLGMIETEIKPHLSGKPERETTFFSPGYTPSLTWRGPMAFTVHDLILLDVPEESSTAKKVFYERVVRRAIRRPDTVVLTVSEFSRYRIADWAGVDPTRITTVGNGVAPSYSPVGPRKKRARPYVLNVGNTKPHKNLDRLVMAVAQVPDVDLMLSGCPDSNLLALASRLGMADRLVFLSGVTEDDLPSVIRGAAVLAIPSLYEGFGLPALEGMACGVPVLASAGGALEEVVGDAGVLIDPIEVDSIRDGLVRTLSEDGLRADLAARGPLRAQAFQWDQVGRRVCDALGVASPERPSIATPPASTVPKVSTAPKVTIAHDYLTQRGGAERVVLNLMATFPDAPIVTTLYNPDTTYPEFADRQVMTSPLNRVGLLRSHFRFGLPLFGWAFDRAAVPSDTQVVVASTTGFAHGVKTPPGTRKLVYCHSPARFLYLVDDYLGGPWWKTPVGWVLTTLRPALTRWDRRAAASADRYLCNSTVVKQRIKEVYGIDATVVHPPHGLDPTAPQHPVAGIADWHGFYLVVSRLMPYKHVDVAMDAFRGLPEERLVIVGRGPLADQLHTAAPSNVRFLEGVSDAELRWAYAHCQAVIAPSREDYGLTPVEGFSFGKPCLALRSGGYLDTVAEGVSGWFFDTATPTAIQTAIRHLSEHPLGEDRILDYAESFSPEEFNRRVRAAVAELMAGSPA